MTTRERVLLAATLVSAFLLSSLKYSLEAFPRKVWRGEPGERSRELCPDGMDHQIDLFAAFLRGEPGAREGLHAFLQSTYQSSTQAASLLAAPLRLLGVPAYLSFCIVSAAASALLLLLLWRLLGELLAGAPGLRLAAFAVFALHPATIRCLVRPQTDALYALAAFSAIVWGRRLARGATHDTIRGSTWARLFATQLASLFVKIHAVVLPFVPAVVAFLHGLRGRRLVAALVFGGALPLLAWAAIFQAFGLWITIDNIWKLKVEFFANWDAWRVVRIVLLMQAPLLAAAALHPRLLRELPLSLLLFLAGYGVLLWLTITPPIARYVYPAQAPLVVLAASALEERFRRFGKSGGSRVATSWMGVALGAQIVLLALYFYVQTYLRYVGPTRDIAALAKFVYDLQ